MTAVGRLGWVQVDSVDPVGLARFWSAVLGRPIGESYGDPPRYVGLVPPAAVNTLRPSAVVFCCCEPLTATSAGFKGCRKSTVYVPA